MSRRQKAGSTVCHGTAMLETRTQIFCLERDRRTHGDSLAALGADLAPTTRQWSLRLSPAAVQSVKLVTSAPGLPKLR
jgi:hypothetical protein